MLKLFESVEEGSFCGTSESSFSGTTYMKLGGFIVGPVTGGFHVTNNEGMSLA